MKRLHQFAEKYTVILLFMIVILGGVLRFSHLTQAPPALNWDEVAMGYNAYSILNSGRDEFGKTLPVYFRSLNDYKRPVYVYATVASEALFGMNDFAVRFPAAFFGTLTIVLIYFLSLTLLKNKTIALLSALCLAIVPWHIQFSRAAFESTPGLFLTGLGILLSIWGIKRNLWLLPLAALSFGLSLYSYLGQRVVVPLLMLTVAVIFAKQIRTIFRAGKTKQIVPVSLAVFIAVFFLVMLGLDSRNPEGNIRYQATSIFTHADEYKEAEKRMQYAATQKINIPRRVFHDLPYFTSLELVMRGYLAHFSPDFFFFDRGQEHHHAPGAGILYIWMLPFLLVGIYFLLRSGNLLSRAVIIIWLTGTPLAAAVTFQIPHALRVAEMILPVQILIACGLYYFFTEIMKKRQVLVLPLVTVLLLISGFYLWYFLYEYHVHLPHERSKDWVYGRKEAVAYSEAHKNKYDKIIVSTALEFPHIFWLYYTKYDPAKYLATGGTHTGSFDDEANAFDKYEFHRFNYDKDSTPGKILFIGKPDEFPDTVTPLKQIKYLNGDRAISIVESKGK
jgi:4-amino-4-deoxy-L-arabinose transferase-like glycosyltransferase